MSKPDVRADMKAARPAFAETSREQTQLNFSRFV